LRDYIYGADAITPTDDFPYKNNIVEKLPVLNNGVDPKFIVPAS